MQPLVIKTLGWKVDVEVERIQEAWTRRARTMATPSEAIYVTRYDEERLRRTSASTQLAVKALPKEEKTWDSLHNITVGKRSSLKKKRNGSLGRSRGTSL
jgi:hypothetical protein